MAGPIRIAILANGSQASREMRGIARDGTTMGDRLKGIGKKVAGGIAIGAAGVAAFGVSAVKSASDAQQSLGATEAVFGRYANTVVKRSNEAADAIGLSANEYRELSNLAGSMLKGAGTPIAKVTELTDKLNTRAADLAATFGGSTREAVEAMGATLRGEYDPIERYGISVRKSDVNARLAAKGLDKLTGSALKQAEQQETLKLLFEQSGDAAGQFARESGTLAGQQQRANAEFENAKASLGNALLPLATRFFRFVRSEGVPALERLAEWLNANSDEITAAGEAFADKFFPALEKTVGVARDVVTFISQIPAPVRNLAVQAGVAALVLPRLQSGLMIASSAMGTFSAKTKQSYAEMTYATTRGQKLRAMLGGVGGVARQAAGIGGLLGVVDSGNRASKSMSVLQGAASGALSGVALGAFGGPVGAAIGGAIGGLAGGMYGLYSNTKQAGDSASDAKPKWDNLKDTLDGVTGAATQATRAQVLQRLETAGLTQAGSQLGLSTRTLVSASLGNEAAMRRVSQATNKAKDTDLLSMTTKDRLASATSKLRGEYGNAAAEIQRNTAATFDFGNTLKSLPKDKRIKIEATGVIPTTAGIAKIARQAKLTPKEIRTLIRATGVETTVKQVQDVNKNLKNTGNVKPNFAPFQRGLRSDVDRGKRSADNGASDINRLLFQGTGKARANLAPFRGSLSAGIASARGTASSGGSGVGNALGSGVASGVSAWAGRTAAAAARMVRLAIAAARGAAAARSPSRKTTQLGRDMGRGLENGMRASRGRTRKAAQLLSKSALLGLRDGTDGTAKVVERFQAVIKARSKGKRETALLKRYSDEFKALQKNGRAQDRVNEKLTAAKDKVKELVDARNAYADTIRDSITGFGGIVGLGRNEDDGTVAVKGLLDQLKDRVAQAKRFSVLIQSLSTTGLSQANLEQLLSAGPEAASATAEAIASGGKAAITELNALTKDLSSTGSQLGSTMAATFQNAGIQAAQGIVNGLEREAKRLDRSATKLAKSLVKSIKKALGIRSPSRVFAQLGKQSVQGLAIGLDDTYVSKQGQRLGDSLVKGFGTPALDAYMSTVGTGSTAGTNVTINVNVPATANPVAVGREVQSALDAYFAAGGRRSS